MWCGLQREPRVKPRILALWSSSSGSFFLDEDDCDTARVGHARGGGASDRTLRDSPRPSRPSNPLLNYRHFAMSRLRRVMAHIAQTATLNPAVGQLPTFRLPVA
jgi:hypothetical protein